MGLKKHVLHQKQTIDFQIRAFSSSSGGSWINSWFLARMDVLIDAVRGICALMLIWVPFELKRVKIIKKFEVFAVKSLKFSEPFC